MLLQFEWECKLLQPLWASQAAQTGKNLSPVWETPVWFLNGEDPLEKDMATAKLEKTKNRIVIAAMKLKNKTKIKREKCWQRSIKNGILHIGEQQFKWLLVSPQTMRARLPRNLLHGIKEKKNLSTQNSIGCENIF